MKATEIKPQPKPEGFWKTLFRRYWREYDLPLLGRTAFWNARMDGKGGALFDDGIILRQLPWPLVRAVKIQDGYLLVFKKTLQPDPQPADTIPLYELWHFTTNKFGEGSLRPIGSYANIDEIRDTYFTAASRDFPDLLGIFGLDGVRIGQDLPPFPFRFVTAKNDKYAELPFVEFYDPTLDKEKDFIALLSLNSSTIVLERDRDGIHKLTCVSIPYVKTILLADTATTTRIMRVDDTGTLTDPFEEPNVHFRLALNPEYVFYNDTYNYIPVFHLTPGAPKLNCVGLLRIADDTDLPIRVVLPMTHTIEYILEQAPLIADQEEEPQENNPFIQGHGAGGILDMQ